jgi:AraC-like DNA-binding protein
VDALTHLLHDLRVESTLYCRFELAAPWAVAYPAGDTAAFHVVTEGRCRLEVEGREPVPLEAGELAILPHGTAHVLRAGGRVPAVPVEDLAGRAVEGVARLDGAGERAAYLCGAFRFGERRDHPLLSALPEAIHLRRDQRAALPWLETHLAAIACEATSGRPGAEIVVTRLSEVLFVQAVRAHLAALPEGARGWVGALRDPPVARALALIHRHPERPWTVESLGRAVGLSRSQFAARFAAAVGEPPLAYLSGWRMHRARSLLRDGTVRMGRIAALLGYGSEAAFSTAFKRWTGTAPGAFRKTARLEADAAREAA